jgi:PLD-like domain
MPEGPSQIFKSGPDALVWLRERLTAGAAATIAVAFWGSDSIEQLGLNNRDHNSHKLRIVCNLAMGGTNPFEIERLMKLQGILVEQSDRLHGKVYFFDDAVMIGSSNASANGLSFEGNDALGWHEANIVSYDPDVVKSASDWLSGLGSCEITPSAIEAAKIAWTKRRQNLSPLGTGQSILGLLRDKSALTGRGVFVVVYQAEMDQDGVHALDDAQGRYGPNVDAFQDWPELPFGTLICFYRGRKGGIKFDSVWLRSPNLEDFDIGDDTKLQLCVRAPVPLGLTHPTKDAGWRAVIDWIVTNIGPVNQEFSQFVDLADVTLQSKI